MDFARMVSNVNKRVKRLKCVSHVGNLAGLISQQQNVYKNGTDVSSFQSLL